MDQANKMVGTTPARVAVAVVVWLILAIGPGPTSKGADVFLNTDRSLDRGMQAASTHIANGQYLQALLYLDQVLGREEDAFVSLGSQGLIGAKEAARAMIAALPLEGRETYETRFGADARRGIAEAISADDEHRLKLLVERYALTRAGQEGALALARRYSDRGEQHLAALLYDRLLSVPFIAERFGDQLTLLAASSQWSSGNEARAEALLKQLADAGAQLEVAGRRPNATASTDWLSESLGLAKARGPESPGDWTSNGCNAAHTYQASGGLPHTRPQWEVDLLTPSLGELHDNLAQDRFQRSLSAICTSSPLAVGGCVFVRTQSGLLAVDFRTGKRIWKVDQPEPSMQHLLQQTFRGDQPGVSPEAVASFAQKVWGDALRSAISSDGERVFMLAESPQQGRYPGEEAIIIAGNISLKRFLQ